MENLNTRAAALGIVLGLVGVACTQAQPVKQAPSPAPAVSARPAPADPALDDELVGTTLPEWKAEAWLNTPPLTLAGLHGHVVLVRWFMGTSCPMCSATAHSLNALHHDYAAKGLTVVGMYHHKEPEPLKPGEYEGYAKSFGFAFPVALDTDWATLKKWWLDVPSRKFTSVSFLLDRQGRVRGVHPGGLYAPGDEAYESVKRGIENLLAER